MKDLTKFVNFLSNFNRIERRVLIKGEKRLENNAEHTFQLATIAWYLIESKKLKLNLKKIFKYAIAHDLVEIYAGDMSFFRSNDDDKKKEIREEKARVKIKKEFPEFTMLHTTILDYEKMKDKESRFIYALDKLLPVMNIYLDNGRSWQSDGVTLEMAKTKRKKISKSKDVLKIWDELYRKLKKNKNRLFRK